MFNSKGIALEENKLYIEEEIKNTILRWSNRNFSIKGKVVLLRSLLYSKMYCLANIIPMPDRYLDNICQKINKWIWGNKLPPVKLSRIFDKIPSGGLNLGNIRNITSNILAKKIARVLVPYNPWEIGQQESWAKCLGKYKTDFLAKLANKLNSTTNPHYLRKDRYWREVHKLYLTWGIKTRMDVVVSRNVYTRNIVININNKV